MRDPYVYEGTNVLINSGNLQDQDKLEEYENALSSLALLELLNHPFEVKSCLDVLKIHQAIFGNIYPFAGKIRSIDICKEEPVLGGLSVDYATHSQIETALRGLDSELFALDWGKIRKRNLAKEIAFFLAKIWKIHPFREGNTRSCTIFMLFFLKQRHLRFNEDFLGKHAKYFRNALVLYSVDEAPEKEPLETILEDAVSARVLGKADEPKYQTIKDYKIEKYQYGYHHLKENSDDKKK